MQGLTPTQLPYVPIIVLSNLRVNLSSPTTSSLNASYNTAQVATVTLSLFSDNLLHLYSLFKLVLILWILHASWQLCAKWFRTEMIRRLTAMNDLDSLTRSREAGDKIKGTAVVAGGR